MRSDLASTNEEKRAANYVMRLTVAVQDVGYYGSEYNPPETQKQLEKAFRVLQPAVVYYHDEPLCWTPSAGKFKPKRKS
jgi:hypothetical protein